MPFPSSASPARESFRRDGFLSLPGFLAPGEVDELNRAWRRFQQQVLPGLPATDVYREALEDPASLKQVQRLHRHDPFFAGLLHDSAFSRLAEQLLGEAVVGRNLQYFDKPAGRGRATPPHQDGAYFLLRRGEAVTLWLALEEVGEVQGCVRYVRGSHLRGAREHARSEVLGFSRGIVDFGRAEDRADEVAIPCSPGHLLAHHAWTIHRAEANRSPRRGRRALGFIYFGRSAQEDRAAHDEYQRRLARELAREGKIAAGPQGPPER